MQTPSNKSEGITQRIGVRKTGRVHDPSYVVVVVVRSQRPKNSRLLFFVHCCCCCCWTVSATIPYPPANNRRAQSAVTTGGFSLGRPPIPAPETCVIGMARVHSCNDQRHRTHTVSRHFQRRRRLPLSFCGQCVDLGRALDDIFADGLRGTKPKDRLVAKEMADGASGGAADDTSHHQHMRRDRSLWELILATFFVAFLVGFVCVLCIGNYFRAKRAMERQRELRRRRANSSAGGSGTNQNGSSHTTDSPRSLASESTANTDNQQNYHNVNNNERRYLLGGGPPQPRGPPELPRRRAGLLSGPSPSPPTEDLLLFPDREGGDGSGGEKPKIMRV